MTWEHVLVASLEGHETTVYVTPADGKLRLALKLNYPVTSPALEAYHAVTVDLTQRDAALIAEQLATWAERGD